MFSSSLSSIQSMVSRVALNILGTVVCCGSLAEEMSSTWACPSISTLTCSTGLDEGVVGTAVS